MIRKVTVELEERERDEVVRRLEYVLASGSRYQHGCNETPNTLHGSDRLKIENAIRKLTQAFAQDSSDAT